MTWSIRGEYQLERPSLLEGGRTLIMHPLDIVAMTHRNPFDRLDAAMKLIVEQAHKRLDRLSQRLLDEQEHPELWVVQCTWCLRVVERGEIVLGAGPLCADCAREAKEHLT